MDDIEDEFGGLRGGCVGCVCVCVYGLDLPGLSRDREFGRMDE